MLTIDHLNNISVIIVEPRTVGNIGSICRACKIMGISNLILVNPGDYKVDETYWMAWGSKDLLDSATQVSTLEEAIKDHSIIVGTSHRRRRGQIPFFTPKELMPLIIPKLPAEKIAILFGRENNGLSEAELDLCNYVSSIPLATHYPSMNLSHAVQIYVYEVFQAIIEAVNKNSLPEKYIMEKYQWNLANQNELTSMYNHLTRIIDKLPFKARISNEKFSQLFHRIFNRSQLEKRDVRLFQKFFTLLENKFEEKN